MFWMVLSDLFPLLMFCLILDPFRPVSVALIASRLGSLVFHLTRDDETRPYLVCVDYIGLSFMTLASLDACDRVHCAYRVEYVWFMLIFWAICLCVFFYGLLAKRMLPTQFIFSLAFAGQYPAIYAVVVGDVRAPFLVSSAVVMTVGYFIVEKYVGHIWWHWTASIGQVLLLV